LGISFAGPQGGLFVSRPDLFAGIFGSPEIASDDSLAHAHYLGRITLTDGYTKGSKLPRKPAKIN
jgi:hypothetical protein